MGINTNKLTAIAALTPKEGGREERRGEREEGRGEGEGTRRGKEEVGGDEK